MFLKAITTFDCPMKEAKSTVSFLHCEAVGVNIAVFAGAVANTAPNFE